MQRRAAIWILGAFKISPVEGIKAIAGIIPIKLHLQKLANRSQLCTLALPPNYLVQTFMNNLSQIRYLLVVILELNSVSEVQYKGIMTDR